MAQSKRKKKAPIVIPLPKVKARRVMPKPTRVIPDPRKEAGRTACRRKVAAEDGDGESSRGGGERRP